MQAFSFMSQIRSSPTLWGQDFSETVVVMSLVRIIMQAISYLEYAASMSCLQFLNSPHTSFETSFPKGFATQPSQQQTFRVHVYMLSILTNKCVQLSRERAWILSTTCVHMRAGSSWFECMYLHKHDNIKRIKQLDGQFHAGQHKEARSNQINLCTTVVHQTHASKLNTMCIRRMTSCSTKHRCKQA